MVFALIQMSLVILIHYHKKLIAKIFAKTLNLMMVHIVEFDMLKEGREKGEYP